MPISYIMKVTNGFCHFFQLVHILDYKIHQLIAYLDSLLWRSYWEVNHGSDMGLMMSGNNSWSVLTQISDAIVLVRHNELTDLKKLCLVAPYGGINLGQVMACCLMEARPLSELKLTYRQRYSVAFIFGQIWPLVISAPADSLASSGARPSADTVLN